MPYVLLLSATLLSAATVNTHDRYIPLIQDGGGWKTLIVVANPAKETAQVEVIEGLRRTLAGSPEGVRGAVTGQLVSAT